MNKWLLLVLGIVSILLLSYLSFEQKATIIQEELLKKADTLHQNPAFKDVYIRLKGEGFTLTRELILLGNVSSQEEKDLASQLLQEINGVTKVNNLLKVQKLKPIFKEVERVEEVTTSSKEESSQEEQKNRIDTTEVTNKESNITELNTTTQKENNLSIELNENNTTEFDSTQQQSIENNESNQSSSCQEQLNNILAKSKIHFANNSSSIKMSSYQQLDQISTILKECSTALIVIDGYSDNSGEATYNKRLSQLRANRVRAYLISKGIDKESIKAFGHGAENPIASNATKEGREKNRRIEFTIKNETEKE